MLKHESVVEAGHVVSGKYKLVRLLGDGGMGSVYEAEHLTLGTRVAIKVLHPELARRSTIAERFIQEARISAQIRSPHVVQVSDVDRTPDGVAYLVMELLQGQPLSAITTRQQRLPIHVACNYACQILRALEAAHALGVIHRDLKPDNVFLTTQRGEVVLKLIDFGIAKLKTAQIGETRNLTVAGTLMGTPEYMAPEQAYSADKVDARADLFAVGVMLYELIAGRPFAEAGDPRVLIFKVERGEITPLVQAAPGIEPQLAGLVHRAMAPRPELRFSSATEMREALEAVVGGGRASLSVDRGAAATPPGAEAALGTGTVMGAPVPAALLQAAPVAMPLNASPSSHGKTSIGEMPVGPPHGMPIAHSEYRPLPIPPSMPRLDDEDSPRQGTGLIVGLAALALILGAAAVVAYVLSTQGSSQTSAPLPPWPTATPSVASVTGTGQAPIASPIVPASPLAPAMPAPVVQGPSNLPGPNPNLPTVRDASAPIVVDAGPSIQVQLDAGNGQTTVVTPLGTFQFPGPRPPFYPPDQPWPPTTITPLPSVPR
jgi:tRNA A-37 threonylcarbamoyl transferase component Bud32